MQEYALIYKDDILLIFWADPYQVNYLAQRVASITLEISGHPSMPQFLSRLVGETVFYTLARLTPDGMESIITFQGVLTRVEHSIDYDGALTHSDITIEALFQKKRVLPRAFLLASVTKPQNLFLIGFDDGEIQTWTLDVYFAKSNEYEWHQPEAVPRIEWQIPIIQDANWDFDNPSIETMTVTLQKYVFAKRVLWLGFNDKLREWFVLDTREAGDQ